MALSLYVHIPFCIKRCIYCDFVSGIYDPEKAFAYIEALKKEILEIPNGTPLATLYIGGGTPTALSVDTLSDLINCISGHFDFIENHEATIEANPGTLDKEKLQAIRSAGINRISLGAQSFNDDELSFLGRIHNHEEAEQAVHLSRDAGFENIGIDLIYGLPGQGVNSWRKTLERAVSLKPEHISAYELTVEKGTLLYKYFREGVEKPGHPDEDKIIGMYNHAIDYLTANGFIHYEISNFGMPDYFSRHNLNYWDRGEYYGTGLGAHSFINGKRFYNTSDLDEYIKTISESKSPMKDSEKITEEKALSEAIFLGLRKTEGVNVESFFRRYNKNILSLFHKEIRDLQEAGLIEIRGASCSYETNVRLTKKGLMLSNEVFEKFI